MGYEKEKKQFKLYFLVIIVVVSFSLGLAWGKKDALSGRDSLPPVNGQTNDLTASDFKILQDAWKVLNKKYAGDLPAKELALEEATKGLVKGVGDPYTVFWNKAESESFSEDMEGSFEGIGAEIGIRDDTLTVIAPLDGMPAQKVGIKANDKILKINEEITNEMSLDEAVKKIRGPEGSQVKLLIFRDTEKNGEPFEVEITRAKIDTKSVSWEEKEDKIAYIRVSGFLKDTEAEFGAILKEIFRSDSDKIVLDLRNNPGGYLETAVVLTGFFVEKGSLVVTEDYGENNQHLNKKHLTSNKPVLKDYPVIVLINEGTASSAEIMAGALRDNRGIKLVGKKTFGKGSVQEVERMEYGSSLKVTVAKWLTPSGNNIDKEGIKPDLEEEFLINEKGEGQDNQLNKALELLK